MNVSVKFENITVCDSEMANYFVTTFLIIDW